MSEILERGVFLNCLHSQTEAARREEISLIESHDAALRTALATAERERDEARAEAERLVALVQGWYEGRARIGARMTFVDQRFYDSVRCERTGWPGDDEHGDGGPHEE